MKDEDKKLIDLYSSDIINQLSKVDKQVRKSIMNVVYDSYCKTCCAKRDATEILCEDCYVKCDWW